MSQATTLKLVREREPGDNYAFERRSAHRKPLRRQVTALSTDTHGGERRNKICWLQVRDISRTGVGAISAEPLVPGAIISIFFPPQQELGGMDLYGRVARCEPTDDGYAIGVKLISQQQVA